MNFTAVKAVIIPLQMSIYGALANQTLFDSNVTLSQLNRIRSCSPLSRQRLEKYAEQRESSNQLDRNRASALLYHKDVKPNVIKDVILKQKIRKIPKYEISIFSKYYKSERGETELHLNKDLGVYLKYNNTYTELLKYEKERPALERFRKFMVTGELEEVGDDE